MQAANSAVAGDYSCSIDPPLFRVFTSNGGYTTPTFEAFVQNGVGDYEYLWIADGGVGSSIKINNPTASRTNLNVSSYNQEIEITLRCTVKDKGNGNAETSAEANLIINFGDLL